MRPILLATALSSLVVGACGGGKGTSTTTTAEGPKSVTAPSVPPAGDAEANEAPQATGLTEQDCEGLLSHLFQLAYEPNIQSVPEAERPSPEELVVAKDELRVELFQQCVGADRERFAFDCAMAAQNAQDLGGCMGNSSGS